MKKNLNYAKNFPFRENWKNKNLIMDKNQER